MLCNNGSLYNQIWFWLDLVCLSLILHLPTLLIHQKFSCCFPSIIFSSNFFLVTRSKKDWVIVLRQLLETVPFDLFAVHEIRWNIMGSIHQYSILSRNQISVSKHNGFNTSVSFKDAFCFVLLVFFFAGPLFLFSVSLLNLLFLFHNSLSIGGLWCYSWRTRTTLSWMWLNQ